MAEVSECYQDEVGMLLGYPWHQYRLPTHLCQIHLANQPNLLEHQQESCQDRLWHVHLLGCILEKYVWKNFWPMNQWMIEVRQKVLDFLKIKEKEVSVVQCLEQEPVHHLHRQMMGARLVIVLRLGLKDWEQEERLEWVY